MKIFDPKLTGSIEFQSPVVGAGITSSLFGTASWSQRSVSASYFSGSISSAITSQTASYVLPLRQDVQVTGSLLMTQSAISAVDWVDFTVNLGVPPHVEGRIHWNVDRKTVQVDTEVNNFMIPVGHANVLRGRNTNSYTLTKGTVVYINGNSGQFATFGTASWEDDPRSAYTIGILSQDINTNNYGYAITNGEITGIDTTAYPPATLLYLSSSGTYTDQKPYAPLHTVRLGQVVVQSVNGILQVKVDNGYETDELHDVLLIASSSGDLLVRSGSLWINSKQLTGSYGLTGSLSVTDFIAVNANTLDPVNPQALLVSGSSLNIISGEAAIDDYAQLNIINKFAGGNSSADIVATNDAASEFGNYVDLGINSSNYGGLIGSNNEAYLYNTGSNFVIGNITRGTDANVKFFAGNDAQIFPLIVTGSVIIATGSLQGSASFATTASFSTSASFATTASYALNGGVTQIIAGTNVSISPTNGLGAVTITSTGGSGNAFPFTGSAQITGSLGLTGSASIIGTFRFNEAADPGGATTNAVFLFASRSEDGVDTDWYYRHSGNLWNYDWFENIVDTGLIYGGIVTITGSTGVDSPPNTSEIRVTQGLGLFVNHNATTSSKGETVATLVPFGPFTQSFKDYITSSQAAYLYVDTAGQLQYQTSIFTTDQYHQAFPLGVFFALTTSSIASWGDLRVTNYGQQQQAGEFIRAFGPLKVNGFNITAQSGSLSASISAGKTFRYGGFYTQDPDSPSIYDSAAVPTASFVRVYQDPTAIGGFKATTNNGFPFRAVDPTKWDNGSGTLQTVGSGEFTIQRIFQGVVNGVSYIYYGQNKYASLAAAIQNVTTENFNESQTSIINLPFIGYVIAEGTATNLADTGSARIINSGLFRNTAGSSGGGGASVTALNDLSDVALTVPTNGQALVYESGVWINSDPKTAATASYLNDLTQHLKITGSLIVTGSNGSSEFTVVGQTVFSGSVIMTSSQGQTVDALTVVGGVCVTGSLVVSGSGGYGVFSKGITLADLTNGFDVTGSYFVWRAPYPATVVGLWAIKSGSSNVSVNARRSGSATNHAASNLTITANNLWSSAATTQDRNYSAGDSLEIIFSGSAVIESSVQVDFIKR